MLEYMQNNIFMQVYEYGAILVGEWTSKQIRYVYKRSTLTYTSMLHYARTYNKYETYVCIYYMIAY